MHNLYNCIPGILHEQSRDGVSDSAFLKLMQGFGDGSVSKLLSIKAWELELEMDPQTHIKKKSRYGK